MYIALTDQQLPMYRAGQMHSSMHHQAASILFTYVYSTMT